ncbi:MAG: hypothetical protein HEEMFOPI_01271 [Holosporales bacterium]
MKKYILISIFALTSCSSVKDTLGIDAAKADDNAVIEQAPLTMPEDIALPCPYAPSTQQSLEERALNILLKEEK